MTTEVKKSSSAEKITAILNKLEIGKAIEAWHEAGDKLRLRIDQNQKELDTHKKKLPTKES